MDKNTTVCFTGHRPKDLYGYLDENDYKYENLIENIVLIVDDLYDRGYRTFITGGAQGFDQCAFWAVNRVRNEHSDIKNVVYAPSRWQDRFWKGNKRFSSLDYQRILNTADHVEFIGEDYYTGCELDRNKAMINSASVLVALYNLPMSVAGLSKEDSIRKDITSSGTLSTIKLANKEKDYTIIQLKSNDEGNFILRNEYKSKGPTEKQLNRDRNITGIENNNPVPPLPENGFGDVICFDLETTGLSHEKYGDEILQIAIVGSNGNEWCTYIKPNHKEVWPKTEAINHISPSDVKDAPSLEHVLEKIIPCFKKCTTIVGHNIKSFDIPFLISMGFPEIILEDKNKEDTKNLFKEVVPDSSVLKSYSNTGRANYKLETAVNYFCPDFVEEYKNGAHNAMTDTRANLKVYFAMKELQKSKEDLCR